jgi:hypothetical protein
VRRARILPTVVIVVVLGCRSSSPPSAMESDSNEADATAPPPTTNACSEGTRVPLQTALDDSTAKFFLATVTEQRKVNDLETTLVARVTKILHGTGVVVGDVVSERGDGNGEKALRALDDRVTQPGATLLVGCGKSGTALSVNDDPAVLGSIEPCMLLASDAGARDERAARLASAILGGAELARTCAMHALCRGTDPAASAVAIERIAKSYTGDPSTPWGLMDGLRITSIEDAFAEMIHCPGARRLVDPKNGADDANTTAVDAQLAITARDHGRVWLLDANDLLFAMSEPERKKLVARLDAKTRAQAVKDIDAVVEPATKTKLSPLRTLLAGK